MNSEGNKDNSENIDEDMCVAHYRIIFAWRIVLICHESSVDECKLVFYASRATLHAKKECQNIKLIFVESTGWSVKRHALSLF